MIFVRWSMLTHKGRVTVAVIAGLVLLILHLMNMFPATAFSDGSGSTSIEFVEYRWATPMGTYLCLTPVARSKIMRARLTIPGAPKCFLLESVATE